MFPLRFDTMFAANAVIAHRLPLLWLGMVSPGGRHSREVERMVTEKIAATVEGAMLAPVAMLQATMAINRDCGMGAPAPLAATAALNKAARTMLAPTERRVRSNASRLGRKRPA